MSRKPGAAVVAAAVFVAVSAGNAADHSTRGKYKSHLADDVLFEDGRILGGDLFFSTPGMDTVVAVEGTEIKQSVPPVVWQYSALLPVSDYLKTAAIHSAGTDEKIRLWQEVQSTFYKGLLTEGASQMDAKIAFLGAYSFAPRWALVEFTRIEERVPVYQDTELYSVEYILPFEKGMTLEAYRKLALEILRQPEQFSIEDIKVAVDAADSIKMDSAGVNSGGIDLNSTDQPVAGEIEVPASSVVVELVPEPTGVGVAVDFGGMLPDSDSQIVARTGDTALIAEAEKFAEPVSVKVAPVVVEDALIVSALPADKAGSTAVFTGNDILSSGSEPARGIAVERAVLELALENPEDEWVSLPDGTVILHSADRLLSQ